MRPAQIKVRGRDVTDPVAEAEALLNGLSDRFTQCQPMLSSDITLNSTVADPV